MYLLGSLDGFIMFLIRCDIPGYIERHKTRCQRSASLLSYGSSEWSMTRPYFNTTLCHIACSSLQSTIGTIKFLYSLPKSFNSQISLVILDFHRTTHIRLQRRKTYGNRCLARWCWKSVMRRTLFSTKRVLIHPQGRIPS